MAQEEKQEGQLTHGEFMSLRAQSQSADDAASKQEAAKQQLDSFLDSDAGDSGDGDVTATSSEDASQDASGDEEGGDSENKQSKPDALPKYAAKRLDVERKRREAAEREARELRAQLHGDGGESSDGGDAPPYPDKDHYENEQQWLDDLQSWSDGKPMRHRIAMQRKAAAMREQKKSTESTEASKADLIREELMDHLEARLDADKGVSDKTLKQFKRMVSEDEVRLSEGMLQHIVEGSKDPGVLVTELVKKPYKSRLIARSVSEIEQVEALERLEADLSSGEKKTRPGAGKSLPTVEPQGRTTSQGNSIKSGIDYPTFKQMRQNIGTGSGFGVS